MSGRVQSVRLSTPSGMAALNAEVTRQAAMVAYVDDFKLISVRHVAAIEGVRSRLSG